jgi:hypothetical protein
VSVRVWPTHNSGAAVCSKRLFSLTIERSDNALAGLQRLVPRSVLCVPSRGNQVCESGASPPFGLGSPALGMDYASGYSREKWAVYGRFICRIRCIIRRVISCGEMPVEAVGLQKWLMGTAAVSACWRPARPVPENASDISGRFAPGEVIFAWRSGFFGKSSDRADVTLPYRWFLNRLVYTTRIAQIFYPSPQFRYWLTTRRNSAARSSTASSP